MRPFRRMAGFLAALLLLLLGNLSWIQVLDADAIRKQPGNTRLLLEQFNRQRGPILVEGTPIAASARLAGEDFFQRSYTSGAAYAPVTGYYSPLYGATGIERAEDDVLSGRDARLFVDRVQQLFAGHQQAGGAVSLSLDGPAQVAAFRALDGARGAVVAIDARTGAVLVLASSPSFDPQVLAPYDPTRVRAAYAQLTADANHPLLNRALDVLYPASTSIGIVTAAAALQSGNFSADSLLSAPATWSSGDASVHTANGRPCTASGRITLAQAVATQCATALASVGASLGSAALHETARRFGFTAMIGTPLASHRSVIDGVDPGATAAGQSARVSVMQLAEVAAALANEGTAMRPYLVQELRGPDLAPLDRAQPKAIGTPMSKRATIAIGEAILVTANSKRCPECAIDGHPVHAIATDTGDGLFVGYSGSVALAVVVERGTVPDPRGTAITVATSTLRAVFGKHT